jgi:hypothetical protein
MANLKCLSERAFGILLGFFFGAVGIVSVIVALSLMPVVGFIPAILVFVIAYAFFTAPGQKSCFIR